MNTTISENERMARASHFREYNKLRDVKTHKEMTLTYLDMYGSITPLEALTAFGCMRLSAVIFDLRDEGYGIVTDINDGKKKYAIYRWEDEENED